MREQTSWRCIQYEESLKWLRYVKFAAKVRWQEIMFPMHITKRGEGGFPTLKEYVWLLQVEAPNEAESVLAVSGRVRL